MFIAISSAGLVLCINFANKTAADSSNLGIVTVFKGATLVLLIIRLDVG